MSRWLIHENGETDVIWKRYEIHETVERDELSYIYVYKGYANAWNYCKGWNKPNYIRNLWNVEKYIIS